MTSIALPVHTKKELIWQRKLKQNLNLDFFIPIQNPIVSLDSPPLKKIQSDSLHVKIG